MKGDEKFLGSPLLFKSNRSSDFDYIIEKISSRLEGWRANLLSQAARMTLIKSVLASVPIYTMSVFLLPRKITNRIDASLRRFWWTGSSKEGRYLSLKAWDSLCKPKACGGLGFRRARDINFSLISKLGWLLISDGNSLWTTVVNAKYCQVEGFFSTPRPSKASLVVRGIWATRDFIRQNSIWIIGQDSKVNVWDYHWSCGNGIQYDVGVLNPKIKGIDLSGWDRRRLSAYFTPEPTNSLISVDRRLLADSDSVYWKSSSDGKFSLKVAYWDLNKERVAEKDEMCSLIWKSKLHERLKLFLWKLCCDVLPFGSRLQSIFGKTPDPCMLCGQSEGDDDLGSVEKVRWGLPRLGRIKGYVDFAKSDEEGAVAAVFFDPSGSVLAFGAKKVSASSVLQGELEAMRFGVDLATRLHLGGLCILSDNLHLVQSVKAKSCPFWNLHLAFFSLVGALHSGG
ncbi:hypothetical protein G4B88_021813 [Cannabis sativa]|uniref:RNase H type-1 domain-containing protein n=1 Tax=Cannabis sativa TaxID=3483 RepID=A0A7J6EI87_CANSA|nr:hypothetical protein G4B88_021813 [Cannabis sativa]